MRRRALRRAGLAACALALVLPGCGSRTPPPAPPQPPASWSAPAAEGAVPGAWVAALGGAGLEELVREALAANRDLRAASARLDAALAEARIAGAELWPALNGSGSGSRTRSYVQAGPLAGAFENERWGASLDVSWELDLWGRLRAGRDAATQDAAAQAALLHGTRQSLAGQVAKAWSAARAARERAAVSERLRQTLADSVALADARYRAGLVAAENVRELRSALARSEDRLGQERVDAGAATRQLELLLGRAPRAALALPEGLPAEPAPFSAGVPAAALARRPDIAAAEARLRAGVARTDEARASLYPRISLTASAGLASDRLEDLLRGDFGVWSIAGNLLQPIWQGARLRAGVQRAEARERVVIEEFAAAVLTALAEVEDALASESALRERSAAQDRIVGDAEALERAATERLALGAGDALDMLAARRGALEARLERIALAGARLRQRVDLLLALGVEPLAEADGRQRDP